MLLLIKNKNINVEWEIINNDLIIIGTIEDIKYLFLLLEKNNFESIKFKLSFIKYEWNKLFYKLVI